MKKNFGEELRRKRVAANISQALLAFALNRSQNWISEAERGRFVVSEDVAQRVFAAIERFMELRAKEDASASCIFTDLHLPSRVEMMAKITAPNSAGRR
jgi:transcriptional regulator with XRE-family HTH domain